MKAVRRVLAAAVLLAAIAVPEMALAKKPKIHFNFGYYGPGVSVYVGRHPRYYYGPYPYYGRRYYRPRYYRRRYYAPPPPPPYGGRCGYWRDRCAQNWGYGNNNFYGCLRYHGC